MPTQITQTKAARLATQVLDGSSNPYWQQMPAFTGSATVIDTAVLSSDDSTFLYSNTPSLLDQGTTLRDFGFAIPATAKNLRVTLTVRSDTHNPAIVGGATYATQCQFTSSLAATPYFVNHGSTGSGIYDWISNTFDLNPSGSPAFTPAQLNDPNFAVYVRLISSTNVIFFLGRLTVTVRYEDETGQQFFWNEL